MGNRIPPDEARFSVSEAINILSQYAEPDIEVTEKKLRDYESAGLIDLNREKGKRRKYSVSDLLTMYLLLSGTKDLGMTVTALIARLYKISRSQPKQFDPAILDFDPAKLPKGQFADFLNNPSMKVPLKRIQRLMNLVSKIEEFIRINNFIQSAGYAFKCEEDEMLYKETPEGPTPVAPPITEWRSARRARLLTQFYFAEAKLKCLDPVKERQFQDIAEEVNEKVLASLVKDNFVTMVVRQADSCALEGVSSAKY